MPPTRQYIAQIQEAVKILETDGVEGFRTASDIIGQDLSLVVLVTLLRIGFGSIEQCPPDVAINQEVEKVLLEAGLIVG